jgi:hypothetical protein
VKPAENDCGDDSRHPLREVQCEATLKVIDRTEEEDDSGATVIREKERFSQRLTLLYADGRMALLSERAAGKEVGDAERAPADGEADVRETDSRHDNGRFGSSEPTRCRKTG